jgi:hypothetical protein
MQQHQKTMDRNLRTVTPEAEQHFVDEVLETGATVLPSVLTAAEVAQARKRVLAHAEWMPNTRPTPSARHLAGFHRYPELEPLHALLTGKPLIAEIIKRLCGARARTIGLSDITINRSQPWHKDLLRGAFSGHLNSPAPCATGHGSVFKVLAYLQDSSSLQIVPGSHCCDINLHSDQSAVPQAGERTLTLQAKAGDIVIIDICTTHRGSPEAAFEGAKLDDGAKILVSTVYGRHNASLTDEMEHGNAVRLAEWTRQHLT